MTRLSFALLPVLLLAACATSPDPDYYTLAPVNGAVSTDIPYGVKIQQPLLAGYLDRPDIVRQSDAYNIEIDEDHRWAEPLDRMFERVLAQDLQQRMPSAVIMTEDEGGPYDARFTVAVNIQQFNRIEGDQTALEGQLDVKDKATHIQPGSQHVRYVDDGGSSAASGAEKLSKLIGKLADAIVAQVHNQVVTKDNAPPGPKPPMSGD